MCWFQESCSHHFRNVLDLSLEQRGPSHDLRWYSAIQKWNSVSSKCSGNFVIGLNGAKFYFCWGIANFESNLDWERRWGLGTNCFWPFSFRNLTETIGSFLPVPPNTYQKMYFLWVTINFISWHFILLWETGFQVLWFIGHMYLSRYCLLFSLLCNPKQRALKGYIKIKVPAPKIWLTLTKPVACR